MQMDLESTIFSKNVRQRQANTVCMVSLICGIKKTIEMNNTNAKQKQTYRYRKQTGGYQWEEERGKGEIIGID